MLIKSQPLDPKFCEKFKLDDDNESGQKIISQRIGTMFDGNKKIKINFIDRINWIWKDIEGKFYDIKYSVRNHFKWRKTISTLRPWEGFDGIITLMQTHLRDYIETEEKYGSSVEEYKNQKITTAKETIEVLERMKDPIEYSSKRRGEVDAKYPKYQRLITEYENGTCYSGDFVAQGNGWTGKESGNDPREGYFEFVNGIFELKESPDQVETDRLLAELVKYHEEIDTAYKQAEIDSEKDFERLAELLKENLYTWWD